ncbi:MAG: MFS transporter [Opitutaceae bacterium]|nr:MFS transporter [Opitutaceae bacterium]
MNPLALAQDARIAPPFLPAASGRGALAGLSLAILLSSLATSIANVSLPTLAQAFSASFQEVQGVVLAYLLAVTSLIVGIGRIGDLVGRRRLLLAGIVVFTAASVLCGFAPTLGLLVAGRAAQGLGAAAMMALSLAFVGDVVPKAKTGRAMGLLGMMSAVGTALGPSLGGLLIAAAGWRAVFLVNAPLGAAAFALVLRYLPADRADPPPARVRFDAAGTALLALALAAYALALTTGPGQFGRLNAALLAAAAAAAAGLGWVESQAATPLLPPGLLRERGLRTGLVGSLLVSTVMMTTLVVGPFYLSRSLGLGAAAVGLVLSIGPLVAALAGVPAGRLADRLGAPRLTVVGLAGMGAGLLILALPPAPGNVLGYLAPIVIITLGYALFQTANNTAVMRDVAPAQRGVVSGLLNLSRYLGLITGSSVMSAVFAFAAKSRDVASADPASVADGLRGAFAVAAALVALALVIARRDWAGAGVS